jgi:predicted metalloprotease with PDZ domain
VQTIRIAIHHQGTPAQLDVYERAVRGIVRQQQAAIFGELPRFDFGTYTFIADYLPWVNGDGMEHRNSTILTSTGSLRERALGVLGTVSHEFFHAWNVERIRPASLEPFDFEEANMSGELWFAEGFTSYYGPLTLRRAGSRRRAVRAAMGRGTINTVVNAPGRRYFSPVEMSMQAPFVDAATSVDPHNRANTFISYYTWGAGSGSHSTSRSARASPAAHSTTSCARSGRSTACTSATSRHAPLHERRPARHARCGARRRRVRR